MRVVENNSQFTTGHFDLAGLVGLSITHLGVAAELLTWWCAINPMSLRRS